MAATLSPFVPLFWLNKIVGKLDQGSVIHYKFIVSSKEPTKKKQQEKRASRIII